MMYSIQTLLMWPENSFQNFKMRNGNHPIINFYAIYVHEYFSCASKIYMYLYRKKLLVLFTYQ